MAAHIRDNFTEKPTIKIGLLPKHHKTTLCIPNSERLTIPTIFLRRNVSGQSSASYQELIVDTIVNFLSK